MFFQWNGTKLEWDGTNFTVSVTPLISDEAVKVCVKIGASVINSRIFKKEEYGDFRICPESFRFIPNDKKSCGINHVVYKNNSDNDECPVCGKNI